MAYITDQIDEVFALIHAGYRQQPASPALILLAGCSRAGKSWLAGKLVTKITEAAVPVVSLSLDSWLLGVDQRPPGATVIDRYECRAIEDGVSRLLKGKAVFLPVYDPKTRKRLSQQAATPTRIGAGILLVDGVIALAIAQLRGLAMFKVFVDVDDAVRRARLKEFYCGYKDLDRQTAAAILAERESEEVPFVNSSRKFADVIFVNKVEEDA